MFHIANDLAFGFTLEMTSPDKRMPMEEKINDTVPLTRLKSKKKFKEDGGEAEQKLTLLWMPTANTVLQYTSLGKSKRASNRSSKSILLEG